MGHQKPLWAKGSWHIPFLSYGLALFYHMGYPDLQWVNRETTSIFFIYYYIMAGHAIVVAKDITLLFYHGNAVILTLWKWLNGGKWFVWCKFNYINNDLWLVKNNNHLKTRYTELCNFLTKRAWVSQQCTLVVAKDLNISHYLNSWAYLVMIILTII